MKATAHTVIFFAGVARVASVGTVDVSRFVLDAGEALPTGPQGSQGSCFADGGRFVVELHHHVIGQVFLLGIDVVAVHRSKINWASISAEPLHVQELA
ncbi:hypothetical protein [Hymenobacter sp. IS2118]|uniref:hypothetical protein n=1 Tax=Hymenobacter sp. IS2118 TaxID=1505605 RepID=UPI00054EABD7|nr:hypothetical protein [Hymenobacter sp. IS2118]